MQQDDFARLLRNHATIEERCLWDRLRSRQIEGCRFRRQMALGRYVADFVCLERKLVIELDGAFHGQQREKDEARTLWLASQGYRVVRFWNNEILEDIEAVLEGIAKALREGTPRAKPVRPRPPRRRAED